MRLTFAEQLLSARQFHSVLICYLSCDLHKHHLACCLSWSMRAESSRVNQVLGLEAAPVGQNFITPQNIFSRLRVRFQIGLDPDEFLRTFTIGHVGKSSTCHAKNPGQAISPRCSLLHPVQLSGLESSSPMKDLQLQMASQERSERCACQNPRGMCFALITVLLSST